MNIFEERKRLVAAYTQEINGLAIKAEKADAKKLMQGIEQLIENNHTTAPQSPRA